MDSKKKKNLEETYERILNVGFCIVPYEDISDIIGPDPMVYGTAKDERILSFEGVEALFKSQYEQMGNMKPGYERKRIALRISNGGNNACIIEELTFTLSSPEAVHTIFMRATCVMEYLDNQWKLTHWHTSTPVDTENDPWHLEEWKREKEKLQHLVDQQTAELKRNNRELQIEAALERVRASAMAMQKSEGLKTVVEVLYGQLRNLGFQFGAASITIMDPNTGDMDWWMEGIGDGFVLPERCHVPFFDHPGHLQQLEHWKNGTPYSEIEISGQEKKSYDAYYFFQTDFIHAPEPSKQLMMQQESVRFSMAFMKYGALSWSPTPLSKDQATILERFAKVFEQCYTRFLDLQKAEAQAREAQIEAALERVRSKAMAMHNSDELKEIVKVAFNTLHDLDIIIQEGAVSILVFEKGSKDHTQWIVDPEQIYPKPFKIKYSNHSLVTDLIAGWENKSIGYQKIYPFEEKRAYFEYLFEVNEAYKALPLEVKTLLLESKEYGYSIAFGSNSALLVATNLGRLLSHSQFEILHRLAKVFEQAYARFLDLQKAEAQAREAQIEAALEKVRSRAMAMHSSNELKEVARELRTQLGKLGQRDLETCAIHLYEESPTYFHSWAAVRPPQFDGEIIESEVFFPKDGGQLVDEMLTAYFSKQKEYVLLVDGEKAEEWFNLLREHFPEAVDLILESRMIAELNPKKENVFYFSFADFHGGSLVMVTYESPDVESRSLLARFANVFGIAYRRFSDLQKAEAQAREAQIEAALEKIRSSSLAMQKTDDLRNVVKVLFEQMQGLSVDMGFASVSIFIFEDGSRNIRQWLPLPDGVSSLSVPYFDHPISSDLFDAKESGEDFFTKIYTLEEKNTWIEHGFEHTDYRDLPADFKSSLLQASGYAMAITLAKNSGICIPSFEGKLPTPENIQIMKRVGKVFEQAYIRFLDLQKAESQAREAQIEVAVERVRAKALAMHKSTEILQVAVTLKEQMEGLNLSGVTAATIYLEHDDNKIRVWDITELKESEQGPQLSSDFTFRLEDTDPGLWVRRIWNASEKYSVIEMSGDDFIKCEKWIREFDETAADNYREFIRAAKIEHTWHPTVQLEKGKLNLDFTVPPPVEMEFILPKMGAAFDLAYRRFLDLQKAEAQARESQIEVSLERVRSASMAMHKTDELGKVVEMLFLQFSELDLDFYQVWINIFRLEEGVSDCWFSPVKGVINEAYTALVPLEPFENLSIKTWKAGEEFSYLSWNGLREVDKVMKELSALTNHPSFHQIQKKKRMKRVEIVDCNHKYGVIAMAKNEDITDNDRSILKRFANVFEQTYTRFLDLQKAESQAKEAKIESALERVRSRSLAMHHSSELSAVVDTLLREFTNLEFTLTFCIINLIDEKDMSNIVWAANPETGKDPESYYMKFEDYPFHHAMWDAWKAQKKRFVYTIEGKEKEIYDEYLYSETEFRRFPKHVQEANKALERYVAGFTFFKYSGLQTVSVNPISEDELEILERFGRVFEQAYTRFLDLQKAEAQAREAQIESALERVRSRTMAMHSSQDVDITVTTLFDELLKLGVDKSIRSGIGILDKSRRMEVWTASTNPLGQTALDKGILDMGIHQLLTEVQEAWEAKKPTHSYELIGDDLIKYFKAINNAPGYSLQVDLEKLPGKITHYDFFFPEGFLFAFSPTPLSAEISRVFMRFASVFGQTYRRYLDLQKAEAQVREAQIEAALERVRSRSLAMHSSDEFVDASDVMVNQLKELGIDTLRIGIGIINKEDDSTEIWSKSEIEGKVKNTIIGIVPSGLHPIFDRTVDAWKKNESFYSSTRIGLEVKEYYQKLDAFLSYPERKEFNERETMTAFFFLHGSLNVISLDPLKEEDCAIMTRFAKVFGQIYQRFRDLQKAEAQAREAQIEAALERVRSRTMAMHKSDELREAVRVIYEQLEQLHFEATACNIIIMDKESGSMQYWVSGFTQDIYPESYHVPFLNHPYLNAQIEPWKQGEKYAVMEYSGEEKKRFDEIFFSKTGFKNVPEQAKLAMKSLKMAKLSTAYCRYGALQVFGLEPLSEKKGEILRRFAKVFEQTYTRFLDLQKAEAQAREATKQASLDRVRGIIASMRSAADLELITPLIFKELTILGVPFIRCGVFIIDEKQELVNAYLSSPEGNSLGVLRLHYNASVLTQGTVEAWRKGEVYRQHWNKEDFVQWINIMMQQDQIQDSRTYQGAAVPPESLDLHFVPFTQGMLYVGAISPLDERELELVTSLAKAFSIAYARYEDFEKLDKAKSEIESALSELKATQSQLVQQEKLASLGQLTAGIAHEIKNPLNFVNNFSEVSMELVEEAKEERSKSQESRDETLVDEILEDIKSNLTKIHEHGTRANGIVTSMLQHSRGGSGKIDSTDLNALVKEYVNLSFHGMRAAKNPIDVEIDFELDPDIGDVPIIKEDFIRVIINLCNNAFDAMRGKVYQTEDRRRKTEEGDTGNVYNPRLKVRTSLENRQVRISIEDNGPGIPDDIKDKILQPFFTTKKGTEGTGLGLSITHDIIKAHGGELEIETSINKGTTFIIKLSR